MTEVYDKDAHIARLEMVNTALAEKVLALTKRKMVRVDERTEQWRNKYFYVKRQFDALKALAESKGIEVEKLN